MKRQMLALAAATVLTGGVLTGCSSGSDDTGDAPPNVQGTWTGSASYADVSGGTLGGPETLVIEKQDGAMLWGYTEYTDTDGTSVKADVTGTLTADDGIFLTEQGTLWQGELDGDSMTVVVSWAKGPKDHSAFEMTMTKQ